MVDVSSDAVTVISLDRTPERYEQFLSLNPGLAVRRFSAIDGRLLDRDRCIANGLITPSNPYKRTSVGVLSSHVALWRRSILEGRDLHVAEDDAILRSDFLPMARASLASLRKWDIVLWGWNFDWPLKLQLARGLGTAVVQCDQDGLRAEWGAFAASTVTPFLARLISAAGVCCYSISPNGARKLLTLALPVEGLPAAYAFKPDVPWVNAETSVELSRHYARLTSFVSLPPLATTLNRLEESTVQE
jgi:glycosyl transferase family 25